MISQKDLLSGAGEDFIREFMETAAKKSYGKGEQVFGEGDPANRIYSLIDGEVRLSVANTEMVYVADQPEELFGWSALIGQECYSASADCVIPSSAFEIDSGKLERLLRKHPESGVLFYKKLSETLGKRLLKVYGHIKVYASYFEPFSA